MTAVQDGVSGQQHAPAALYPRERNGTYFTGGWVGPRAHRDSIPDHPASSQSLYRLSYRAHIMDNGAVESGKEVVHTDGGGFTGFSKRWDRSVLHRVRTFHGVGTTK